MTAQEIILSGKLELYVAGVLSDREMTEVAILAQEHPEVAAEIAKIEQVMVEFLSPEEYRIPDREKEHQIDLILARIHRSVSNGIDVVPVVEPHVVPMRRRFNYAVAALAVGLLIATGLAVWFGTRSAHLNNDLATVKASEANIASANDQYQDKLTNMQKQMDLMSSIVTKRVQLGTTTGNKLTDSSSYMVLYWNPQTKKLVLSDAHLPKLKNDQQYQLWALYNGQPVDAGVFDPTSLQGATFQKDIPNAQAFAVTVEPKGGSKTPTLSNLCMMGKL